MPAVLGYMYVYAYIHTHLYTHKQIDRECGIQTELNNKLQTFAVNK